MNRGYSRKRGQRKECSMQRREYAVCENKRKPVCLESGEGEECFQMRKKDWADHSDPWRKTNDCKRHTAAPSPI